MRITSLLFATLLLGCSHRSTGAEGSDSLSAPGIAVLRLGARGAPPNPRARSGDDLPEGTEAIEMRVSSVSLRGESGSWTEYEVDERVDLLGEDLAGLLRSADEVVGVDAVRLDGDARIVINGQGYELDISSARGLQVDLDTEVQPHAVNYVTIEVDGRVHQPTGQDWKLDPSLKATVDVSESSLAEATVDPDAGATVTLEDGFELEVPPAAVPEAVDVYVETVTDDDGDTYYILGPEGTQFGVPITVRVPGAHASAVITWDGEPVDGTLDSNGRVEAQGTHFSCIDKFPEETVTSLGDGAARMYDGKLCGAHYSIVAVSLDVPEVRVRGLLGAELHTGTTESDSCAGETVFETTSVPSMLTQSGSATPIAAIQR